MRHDLCGCLVLATFAFVCPASADTPYPTKPVRIVVTIAPGGAAETSTRLLAQSMSLSLGKQILVDNRPGGGGNIGVEIVAKAPPDGYTLLLSGAQQAIAASLYSKLNYDLLKDFLPISLLTASTLAVTVHPALGVKSAGELIAFAKSHPNRLDFSSSGTSSGAHLAGVLFCEMAGIKMNHISHKNAGAGMVALLTGEVAVGFSTVMIALPHGQSGKLRVLGVTSSRRSPVAPALPTISETGLPGYEANLWWGLSAPVGTPPQIVLKLHAESIKSLRLNDVRERLAAIGIEPIGTTPEQYDSHIRAEIFKWKKVVQQSGARPD